MADAYIVAASRSGTPLGSSGTKLMATVHALRRRGKRYGLQTLCEGGGQANLTIIETVWELDALTSDQESFYEH